ncbi:MAG TPA: Leg1-related protein [Kofleriaceae bacterium]|nr:Leg1-related protein [Kofleriaceae bacterium]
MSTDTLDAWLRRIPFGDEWRALPDLSARTSCDPDDAGVRMGLYRLLVERGNPHHALGAHGELSPFWGYASQLAWQRRSGRLGGRGDTIDPASWWGVCNYSLSVVPYLAGAQIGLVPALALPSAPAMYDRSLALWRDTLATMQRLRPGDDHDALRLAVWRAHLESIETAVRAHTAAHRALPSGERGFARGWIRMVELFGCAGWRTDLMRLAEHGGGELPPRILGDDDALTDFTKAERATARRVIALGARPPWRWQLETGMWRRIMRTRAARADAEAILAGLFGRGRAAWPVRARALRLAL